MPQPCTPILRNNIMQSCGYNKLMNSPLLDSKRQDSYNNTQKKNHRLFCYVGTYILRIYITIINKSITINYYIYYVAYVLLYLGTTQSVV